MTPFYFGTDARRLFGIHETAARTGRGTRAAVLCQPWGAEYLNAHRAIRHLALKLAAAGWHALRFDYFGTGDSAGEAMEGDLAGWEADIGLAMAEARDIIGGGPVALIGLRLGATLAARVARQRPRDIHRLVLWDPVIRGADYLADLDGPGPAARMARGTPLSAAMRRDLAAADLAPLLAAPATRTFLLTTQPPAPAQAPAHPPEAPGKASLAHDVIAAAPPWIEDPEAMGVIPVGVIQRIVTWLD
jgi:pimeloyl-ACP methyl ester carboxylesterase